MNKKYDVIFAGLGFANAILAYRLRQVRPDLKMIILEKKEKTGGDYTWSFFSSDIDVHQMEWVRPLIKHQWDMHELIFPEYERLINGVYNSIPSESLFDSLEKSGIEILTGKKISKLSPEDVITDNGERFSADCVFDGRGPRENMKFSAGYQKFVGIDVDLAEPHGMDHPIIMDVRLDQEDGFRFMYVLPWSDTSLMLEDTHYSNTPDYDVQYYKKKMVEYAGSKGWKVKEITRIEHGALLIPMESDPDAEDDIQKGIPVIGIRGEIYNPITSYATPGCIKLADLISNHPVIESAAIAKFIKEKKPCIIKNRKISYMLNKMIFKVAAPETRYKIFEHFYTKNDNLVKRFYSSSSILRDYLNLCIGVPPVPMHRIYRIFT